MIASAAADQTGCRPPRDQAPLPRVIPPAAQRDVSATVMDSTAEILMDERDGSVAAPAHELRRGGKSTGVGGIDASCRES